MSEKRERVQNQPAMLYASWSRVHRGIADEMPCQHTANGLSSDDGVHGVKREDIISA